MVEPLDPTARLVQRWAGGDEQALSELAAQELPWLREQVRRRLGGVLHQKTETEDLVQEVFLKVLRHGPRFVVADRQQLRALLARIVVNVLHDQFKWFHAGRRGLDRQVELPRSSILDLGRTRDAQQPWEQLVDAEQEAWIRMGLELLEPDDRHVILLRDWEELEFEAIGTRLGLAPNAARMRYRRALPRLAHVVQGLRDGRLPELLAGPERTAAGEITAPGERP